MFATVATAFLFFLAVFWSAENGFDLSIKMIAIGLAVWGLIEALISWGFVIAPASGG